MKKRRYKSLVRQRQAGDTRRRIVDAARQLLQSAGYDGMTIEAIAQRAEVSAQSVYAVFRSKTGILTELLDQSTFADEYEEAVRQALSARDPETRLRLAAGIARQIHEPLSAAFDLLRGAGVIAPDLARLEKYQVIRGILHGSKVRERALRKLYPCGCIRMPQPGRPKVLLGQSRPPANRTLNRHWSAGRAYQGVEVIVLKELGKMTP